MEILHNNKKTILDGMTSEELETYYKNNPLSYYENYIRSSISPMYDEKGNGLMLACLGANEEIGEVAGIIMKQTRYGKDAEAKFTKKWGMSVQDKLQDELGDLLFQVVNMINHSGLTIKEVMDNNLYKLDSRHSETGNYFFGAGLGSTRSDGGSFGR